MRKVFALAATATLLCAAASTASAQLPKGYTDISAVLGLGNTGDAGLAPGARFEKVIKDLPSMGGGTLGIMVGANYYSWSSRFLTSKYSLSYLPIGVTGNYHFKITNKKVDAFVGVGLGYQIINCDYDGIGDICDNSAVYAIARLGGRYFYKPNMAIYGDVGAGDAALNVGLSFKLK
jgi:hypothetical protein|eukprot:TRINITY_DN47642_c0_g1_i1.p2 TRINITY_DN47642_c0_g1~~TRINITY_DN47642_c0_g1_i1.p2  ORF type:complete len:177 (+),score=38.11 TRINITY_DN47642_c0_g1_i1:165-695(+)